MAMALGYGHEESSKTLRKPKKKHTHTHTHNRGWQKKTQSEMVCHLYTQTNKQTNKQNQQTIQQTEQPHCFLFSFWGFRRRNQTSSRNSIDPPISLGFRV
jgi:hypothetical protein